MSSLVVARLGACWAEAGACVIAGSWAEAPNVVRQSAVTPSSAKDMLCQKSLSVLGLFRCTRMLRFTTYYQNLTVLFLVPS